MPGRARRVRLLTLASLAFFVLLVYTRNRSRRNQKYQDYFGNKEQIAGKVGGGSVLRPTLNDIPPQQERYPVPHDSTQDEQDVQWETVWVDAPAEDEEADSSDQQQEQQEKQENDPSDQRYDDWDKNVVDVDNTADKDEFTDSEKEETWNEVDGQRPPVPQVPVAAPTTTTTQDQTTTSTTTPATTTTQNAEMDLLEGHGKGRLEVELPTTTRQDDIHWVKPTEFYPVKSTIPLPSGTSKPFPKIQRAEEKLAANGADESKLAKIREAAAFSWREYRANAFGEDEIKPVTGRSGNPFNGWGATLVDALDTLWIMGFEQEFDEAAHRATQIDFTKSARSDIPLFETTIRYLGGLLAAYDITGRNPKYRGLLDKATELGDVMYSAFDTPNRMPQTYYRWQPSWSHDRHRAGSHIVMAELGSLSMEFTRLAQLTGDPKYYDAIARITNELQEFQNATRLPGMWPTELDASGCDISRRSSNYPPTAKQLSRDFYPIDGADVASPLRAGRDQAANVARSDESDDGTIPKLSTSQPQRRDSDFYPLEHFANESEDECIRKPLTSTSEISTEKYTLSGMSDSTYEYLSKEYILLGGLVDQYKDMYLYSTKTVIENLLYKPMTIDERDILMSGELRIHRNASAAEDDPYPYYSDFNPEIAHLACFAGGMFAMGGVVFEKPEHVEIGAKLTNGCVWAYESTKTGIMPEGGSAMKCNETWGKCAWDQQAYMDELDPQWRERVDLARRTSLSQDEISDEALSAFSTPVTGGKPTRRPDLHRKEADGSVDSSSGTLAKRQLDDQTPPPVQPVRPEAPVIPYDFDNDGVLSQQEYVAKRIDQERLPPGFTKITGRRYMLRPEAIESVFYMYRITGDMHWREVGWKMFVAVEYYTKSPHGYSTIDDITLDDPHLQDSEESFWLAETLKYFYLLFDEPSKWSLDEWVLNTEAHFFKRPPFKFAS